MTNKKHLITCSVLLLSSFGDWKMFGLVGVYSGNRYPKRLHRMRIKFPLWFVCLYVLWQLGKEKSCYKQKDSNRCKDVGQYNLPIFCITFSVVIEVKEVHCDILLWCYIPSFFSILDNRVPNSLSLVLTNAVVLIESRTRPCCSFISAVFS